MKFTMLVDHNTAVKLIDAIVEVATTANQQWDFANFYLTPNGAEGAFVQAHNGEKSENRPAEFVNMTGFALSSQISLAPGGDDWKVSFSGTRGSLMEHWTKVWRLLQECGGEVSDYETSVPGMEPWENLYSWFRRIVETREELHPFHPIEDLFETKDFNRRFHLAIKLLARRGKLDAENLRAYRDTIVTDIKRTYDWEEADVA